MSKAFSELKISDTKANHSIYKNLFFTYQNKTAKPNNT